jgi:endonuclease/exonuclease/phosphatase family metal-dependent hydrolase
MHYLNKIGAFLLLGIVTSSIFLIPKKENPAHLSLHASLDRVEEKFNLIKEDSKNSLDSWRMLQALLMEEFATVQQEGLTQDQMEVLAHRVKKIAMPLLKSVFTQGAKNAQSFSEYERHLLYLITVSSMKMVKEGSIAHRFMDGFSTKLSKLDRINYEVRQGINAPKMDVSKLKVLNWNTCMLPGRLATYFGGIAPWEERLGLIVKKIKESKADIICLQEVHSEFAALKLFESLKNDYAYFYMNMGPKMMSANIEDVGLNSGLFVASNIELEEPCFKKFNSENGDKFINKGYFSAKVKNQNVLISTAHLEPNDFPSSELARFEQLSEIIQKFKSSKIGTKILCGDLNIPWGSDEVAFKLIKSHFEDPYNSTREEVNTYSRTYSDYFMNKTGYGSSDILDYFLIFKSNEAKNFHVIMDRLEGFDDALYKHISSDHHGLLTEINQNKD